MPRSRRPSAPGYEPDRLRGASPARGQRDDLLACAAERDDAFAALADPRDLDPGGVRELFAVTGLPDDDRRRWPREAVLRTTRGEHYDPLAHAVDEIRRRTVRASSVAENLNSRLRGTSSSVGNGATSTWPRSNSSSTTAGSRAVSEPVRVGHSPADLRTGL
ncbi:hypothetical protein [Fimbriiglobus ruber]|uniref:hypothetical protein n=1 Tax=Fimbriiglobus ruber TaxID=1908690 RepID=UPI000B4BA95B|nr:hypothetical protein [Fimbriiglobus ruber]